MEAILTVALIITGLFLLRFALITVPVYARLYKSPQRPADKKFNPKLPLASVVKKEFKYSLASLPAFIVFDGLAYLFFLQKKTLIYTEISEYGWLYLFISFPLLMILHDAYFYWLHRLVHLKKFKWIKHSVHHQFTNPTPWAALANSQTENFLQILFHLIVVFILPLHPIVIFSYLIFQFISNTIGHSGYQVGKTESKVFSNSYYHYLHHKKGDAYYGLYFTFWDSLCKTNQ